MRTITLYSLFIVYITITVLLCAVVWERHASWSQYLRLSFNIGTLSILKILAWGNIVSICLFSVAGLIGNIKCLKLTRKNKELEEKVTALKAKLVDSDLQPPTPPAASALNKPDETPPDETPQKETPTFDDTLS